MSLKLQMKKCSFVKSNGKSCGALPMRGMSFCYFHNPEVSAKEKRDHQSKGGKQKLCRISKPLKPLQIKTSNDILGLLEITINQVRDGSIDVKIANSLGFLANHFLKAFEVSALEKRVGALEKKSKEPVNDGRPRSYEELVRMADESM